MGRSIPCRPWSIPCWYEHVSIFGLTSGLSGALYNNSKDTPPPESGGSPEVFRVVLGVLLIAFAQLFTASQFVLEEFIMAKHTIHPVRMVGWEGIFGFTITIIGMPILYAIFGTRESGKGGYFDIPYGAHQLFSKPEIWGTAIAIMFSIGYFFPPSMQYLI